MKDFLDKNRILLGALALTLIAGLVVIAQRWGVEAENKTYDVVLDYSELELLAEQSEHDIAWWLEQFRDMGITRVGLTEESLSSLMEKSPMAVTATMMDKIMQDANWRSSYPERFVRQMEERESDWVYVSTYMPEGDVHIYGVTNFEATGLGWAGDVTLGEGYNLSLLEGDEPLCLISDKMSQSTGLEIGDTFTMPVCFLQFTSSFGVGKAFSYMNEYSFTVAGTYPARIETIHPADMYLPLDWLRDRLKEDQPENPFTYSSYTGYLADSMKLNEFKDSLKDCGLGQPFFLPTGEMFVSLVSARTIYMDDEEFIRSAEKLGQSIRQYEMFLVPFFVVVVFLVTMSIFLVLRGCRRDMAIACSLGRPKVVTAAANLMAALSAQLLGALLAVPVSMLLTGVGFGTAMLVCGAFMLCALMGDIVGLIMLLRFDALALLTAAQ